MFVFQVSNYLNWSRVSAYCGLLISEKSLDGTQNSFQNGSQAPMVAGGPPLSSALEYMLRGPDTSSFFFHFGFQYVL